MATTVTALVNAVEIKVDDLGRDDFLIMRVWMSTVSGFVPGAGNLVYEGADQKIIMSGLTADTPYYFKIARVSEINTASVLTSVELSATPTAPSVAASNITGQLTDAQIAAVAAAKITGQLVNAQLADIAATKVTGQLTDAQIAAVAAAKVTGQLTNAQLADIASTKITGQLTDAQLAAIGAAKVTGQLTASQLGVAVGGGNLLKNSSFEADSNGDGVPDSWSSLSAGTGTTVARSTPATPLRHGAKALQLAITALASPTTQYAMVGYDLAVASLPQVRAGQKYVLSVYAKTDTLSYSIISHVQWLDSANALISTSVVSASLTQINTTQRCILPTLTAPANAVRVRLYFGINRPSVADTTLGTMIFDGVQLEEGDVSTAYAPMPDEILPGTINTTEISDNAITSAKIVAGAIVAGKIAASAVSTNELAANAVTAAKIAAGTITATQIAADTITSAQIATSAITATELAAGSVITAKLAAGAVTANELAANSVVAGKIAAGTIVAADIAADTITAAQIAANAITATELNAGAVTTAKIAAGAVTANELAANSVVAGKIAAGTIVTNDLAANAVTAAKIAVGTITATELAAGAITTTKIAAGAVTANEIAANAITASKLLLTDNSNIYPDYDMEDVDFYAGATLSFATTAANNLGRKYAVLAVDAAAQSMVTDWVPVEENVDYLVSGAAWVGNADSTMMLQIQTGTMDAAGVVTLSQTLTVKASTAGYHIIAAHGSYNLRTINGERRVRFRGLRAAGGTGAGACGAFRITRRANASLIVDGEVKAEHLSATALDAKHIRGSHVFSGTIATKGSVLTAPVVAGATTISVQNTVDFPSSGSAVIYATATANDYDVISYTGKTDTSLTGVTGALDHAASNTIIPLAKAMVIDATLNEMRFHGDRGDGTIEKLASIGIRVAGTDSFVAEFGSPFCQHIALYAENDSTQESGSFVQRGSGYALAALSLGTGSAFIAQNDDPSPAAYLNNLGTGPGATVQSFSGPHGLKIIANGSNIASMLFEIGSTASTTAGTRGELTLDSADQLSTWDGTTRRYFVKNKDVVLAANGSAAAPSLSFDGDPDTGMYSNLANTIRFATGGSLAGQIDPNGDWNFTGRAYANTGSVGFPSFSFAGDADTGMYSNLANTIRFATGGTLAATIDSAGVLTVVGVVDTPGIKFPITQVPNAGANVLDDYEEGTFTPVVNGTTTAGSGTYSTQQGTYTKIGDRVCGDITLTWSAHTGTGNIEIGGLPFARKAGGSSPVTFYNQGVAFTAGNTLQGVILTGGSVITITQHSGGGAATGVPIDTAATFRLSFSYPAA